MADTVLVSGEERTTVGSRLHDLARESGAAPAPSSPPPQQANGERPGGAGDAQPQPPAPPAAPPPPSHQAFQALSEGNERKASPPL